MYIRKCRWVRLALLSPLFLPLLVVLPLQSAWSLGLSEIEVDSSLNEKFAATIGLMEIGDLSIDEIIVAMASREGFDRFGVERFFYLTDLSFEVDLKGPPHVVVSSSQTISEPYLNFIVEIRWPKGRLLKEFTVLLDPPTFSDAQAHTRSTSAPVAGEILTTRYDTLWKIAQRTLPAERVTVNQQMLALQQLNPNAFIRNNINLLKAGYRLQLPTESAALALNQQTAAAQVRDQATSWRKLKQEVVAAAPAQVDATPNRRESGSDSTLEQGQVRIVANSGELAQGFVVAGSESADQLLTEKATLSRRVGELAYQLGREKELAASRIELKERQLEVKDQALVELQARVAQMAERANSQQPNQQQKQTANPSRELPRWQSPLLLGGVIGVLVLLLVWLLLQSRRSRDDDVQDYGLVASDEYEEGLVEPVIGAVDHEVLKAAEDDSTSKSDETVQAEGETIVAQTTVAQASDDIAEDQGIDFESDDFDLDFGTEGDSDVNTTKLELAEAYIDMGDDDGAQDILREVCEEGSADQVTKAQQLLDGMGKL